MKRRSSRALWLVALVLLPLGGCGVDGVVFMTKTGLALDADTAPATLDVGYLRHEGVIARVYDDVASGDPKTARPLVHPVLTTVGADTKGFGIEMQHSFATGGAALVFADYLANPADYPLGATSRVPLPVLDGSMLVRKGGGTPYFFGTDTSLGLGVTWAGGSVPKSVSIGYKRKELAIVPLDDEEVGVLADRMLSADQIQQLKQLASADLKARLEELGLQTYLEQQGVWGRPELSVQSLEDAGLLVVYEKSRIPSLIATAQGGAAAAEPSRSGIRVGQTFATGAAATLLAKHGAVRRVLGASLVPDFEAIVALDQSTGRAGIVVLAANVRLLEQLDSSDARAAALRQDLQRLADEFKESAPAFASYKGYKRGDDDKSARLLVAPPREPVAEFVDVLGYLMELRTSVAALREARDDLGKARAALGTPPGPAFTFTVAGADLSTADQVDKVLKDLAIQEELLAATEKQLGEDSRIVETVRYVADKLTGKQ